MIEDTMKTLVMQQLGDKSNYDSSLMNLSSELAGAAMSKAAE